MTRTDQKCGDALVLPPLMLLLLAPWSGHTAGDEGDVDWRVRSGLVGQAGDGGEAAEMSLSCSVASW